MLCSARIRYYSRHMGVRLSEALDSARVVVLHGARQSGKTTLARALASDRGGTYLTMDDDQVLDAALADPHTFVRAYPHPLVMDEIQVAGERLAPQRRRDRQGDQRSPVSHPGSPPKPRILLPANRLPHVPWSGGLQAGSDPQIQPAYRRYPEQKPHAATLREHATLPHTQRHNHPPPRDDSTPR